MKKIFASFLLLLSLISSVHSQELMKVDELIRQGMQVKMGELTGAGSRFSIKNLEGLVLPEGVLLKGDCTGIVVKNSQDPKVSDIVKIKIQGGEILAHEFVGFVVR